MSVPSVRTSAESAVLPPRRRWLTLAVLGVSLLVVGLDTTVLNVALPLLVSELGATTGQLQWIVDIYALLAGALMLFCGGLADRLGRKGVFLTGLVLFTGASVAAAYAGSVTQLIVARGVMGIGEALIMPATLAIIGTVFTDPAERIKAIGVWSAAIGAGTVIGPMLGGWLLDHFWWGSVFLVNLPIGAAGLVAAALLVPAVPAIRGRRLDPLGAALSIAGPALLLWALIQGPSDGWTDPLVLGAFAAAAVLITTFIGWEHRAPNPLLPLGILRHRGLAVGAVLILLCAFAMIGTLFLLVQHLQFNLGYTAAQTGWRLGPMALALLVAGPVAGVLAQRLGVRYVAAAGLALVATALTVFATTSPGDGYGRVLVVVVLLGSGAGFVITATSDSIVGSLPERDLGVGSATNSTAIQFGAALGVAVTGSLLAGRYRGEIGQSALEPVQKAAARDSLGAALTAAEQLPDRAGAAVARIARDAFTAGLGPAMFTGAAIAVIGVVIALALAPRRTNSDDSGVPS
ncbi:DHA2 family efflux MFS transporter permease subunit [Streptomyces flaveus]|uniref:DHA2 family efflux MFS transporter permease subunit n=1 Tax=Streptomyces flaveus TaxID=66370 RepID=UPI00332519F2